MVVFVALLCFLSYSNSIFENLLLKMSPQTEERNFSLL